MSHYIPYGRQSISEEDIKTVVDVLRSDFLTQGPVVPEFEKSVCTYTGASYGVAVNSATSALHIACLALGVGAGDVVWTSPISFVASSNCALYCGAEVDFVDINPDTFNMCPAELERRCELAKKQNKLPKVVIPVHMAGQSCDMEKIHSLSKKYGFKIIEDASHSIGGKYKGKAIGCCDYSDITVFSFHPVKIITTAEGGLATTNDLSLFKKMSILRTHGITRDESLMSENHGPWYYEQVDLGFNYRMTEMQAALGLSQMKRLDSFIVERHRSASQYNLHLNSLNLKIPSQDDKCYSAYHLYIIRVPERSFVFNKLRGENIGANVHYIPIPLQPYYKNRYGSLTEIPNAINYYRHAISLPMFSDLSDAEQGRVIEVLKCSLQ